jgi:hypothetical protein
VGGEVFVVQDITRAIKYLGALAGCIALASSALYISTSEAQDAKSTTRAVPIFGIKVYPGYRDWKLVSVAHEEGSLNDIRAILGNDVAIKAYRGAKLPFPDGSVIARIAWNYVPSEENNKVFGRAQSFVTGGQPEWYLQFMVKDSKKYAATGGWGYAQFDKDGTPAGEAKMQTCYPCHAPIKDRDFVFTRYAP